MSEFIQGFQTTEGEKKYDYNALGNLPDLSISKDDITGALGFVPPSKAEVEASVKVASNAAATADNKAVAAQSTANQAVGAAQTAQSTANTAVTAAQNAQSTADTANQKVDTLRGIVSKFHSNIVCDSKGEVITVSDSAEAPLQNLKVFGKTEQNGIPTPDAPVALESVGDSVNVTVCGKNLLRIPYHRQQLSGNTYKSPGGVTFVTNEDGSITMNGTNTSSANADREYTILGNNKIWLPVGTYTMSTGTALVTDLSWYLGVDMFSGKISGGFVTVRGGSSTFTVTEPGYAYVCIRVNANMTVNNVTVYPQLEVGSVATGYEKPVEAQTLPITTSYGLPGIPVTSGGDYTDPVTGKQWICDEVDFEKGLYVQRICVLELDGETTGKKASTINSQNGIWFMNVGSTTMLQTAKSRSECIISHFGYQFGLVITGKGYISTSGAIVLAHTDQTITTMTAWNEWLKAQYQAGTPVTLLYILESPIPHKLSEIDPDALAKYAQLHTNYPNTTVFNDAGAGMEVKYVADTKLYVDKKFEELAEIIINKL